MMNIVAVVETETVFCFLLIMFRATIGGKCNQYFPVLTLVYIYFFETLAKVGYLLK